MYIKAHHICNDNCPMVSMLSSKQKDILNMILNKDINRLLTVEWITIYKTIPTLACLGLVVVSEPLTYQEQLQCCSIEITERTCKCNNM